MEHKYVRFPKGAILRRAQELSNHLHAHALMTSERLEARANGTDRALQNDKYRDRHADLWECYRVAVDLERMIGQIP